MRVAFAKIQHHGRVLCRWDAVRGKRTRVPGSTMGTGAGLPHDLAQFVVEAATGYPDGFWGLVARGATFKSTGRKRTRPGRALIAAHRETLAASEALAGAHTHAWRQRRDGPVTAALDRALEQWQALRPGQRIVFTWPSPHGKLSPLGQPDPSREHSPAGVEQWP